VHHQCSLLADAKADMKLTEAQTCPAWLLPNDAAAGYYQVAYNSDLLKNVLSDGAGHLSVADRVGVLGDVDLLAGDGEIPAGIALGLVPQFSKDPAPQVVQVAANIARLLKTETVSGDLREKGARFIRQEFGEKAKALGWLAKPGDSDDTRLLRQKLVPFVASAGEQKDLDEEAEKLALAWLKKKQMISPEMLRPLLDVAAEFGDRDLFNLLRTAAIQARDHTLREDLLEALGSFRKPELAAAAMDLLLSKDFDLRESFYPLLFGPLAYAENRDVPFAFVKQHLNSLLQRMPREVGEDYAASLPNVGGGFCDAKRRDELDSFFRDRVKDYTGGARALSQTLEGIDLCIASRKALAPELTAFLSKY
jgi:cytosol alanyl aminopeptidase